MAGRIVEQRSAEVAEMAVAFGATVTPGGRRNLWEVAVAGKHAGKIRYDSGAHLWLATTGKETTLGDLAGCLRFVIRRC